MPSTPSSIMSRGPKSQSNETAGQACRHGLSQHDPPALVTRGQHEGVGGLDPGPGLRRDPRQLDPAARDPTRRAAARGEHAPRPRPRSPASTPGAPAPTRQRPRAEGRSPSAARAGRPRRGHCRRAAARQPAGSSTGFTITRPRRRMLGGKRLERASPSWSRGSRRAGRAGAAVRSKSAQRSAAPGCCAPRRPPAAAAPWRLCSVMHVGAGEEGDDKLGPGGMQRAPQRSDPAGRPQQAAKPRSRRRHAEPQAG